MISRVASFVLLMEFVVCNINMGKRVCCLHAVNGSLAEERIAGKRISFVIIGFGPGAAQVIRLYKINPLHNRVKK